VAWLLHSSADKYRLPWHRVINVKGQISLPHGYGYELQKALLEEEGIVFDNNDTIDLKRFGWRPAEGRVGKRSVRR
jgi:methylated-DNA-protein-cysteine methyltransferase related protein